MATKIQWTNETWNPTTGCDRVSAGCDHCYIERTIPFRMERRRFDEHGEMGVRLHADRLDAPFRWRRPRMVFVNSLSDLFHPAIPSGFVGRVWDVMGQTPQHTYQILTKRPARLRAWVRAWADAASDVEARVASRLPAMPRGPEAVRRVYTSPRARLFAEMLESMGPPPPGAAYPLYDWVEGWRWWPERLPNVWLGVSVEHAKAAWRLRFLHGLPAAVRFASFEPLLGPLGAVDLSDLDWAIVGGESGPGARPMDLDWAREIMAQCREAGVKVFVKQLGAAWARAAGEWRSSAAGSDPEVWPEDLRVREMPA